MQNYKTIDCSNGDLITIKTDEPVTWKLGDDLIVGTVFNIEVLEAEFGRVKLLDPLSDEPNAWECNESVRCYAEDITDEPERAAKLIRESDRLESYWLHLFHIQKGEEPAGTPFDEDEWAENYAWRQARNAAVGSERGLADEVPSTDNRQLYCDENMKEHLQAVETGKQLARVRKLLVKQKADDKLIAAIDQAIADNEFWMNSDLNPDGDSTQRAVDG